MAKKQPAPKKPAREKKAPKVTVLQRIFLGDTQILLTHLAPLRDQSEPRTIFQSTADFLRSYAQQRASDAVASGRGVQKELRDTDPHGWERLYFAVTVMHELLRRTNAGAPLEPLKAMERVLEHMWLELALKYPDWQKVDRRRAA